MFNFKVRIRVRLKIRVRLGVKVRSETGLELRRVGVGLEWYLDLGVLLSISTVEGLGGYLSVFSNNDNDNHHNDDDNNSDMSRLNT